MNAFLCVLVLAAGATEWGVTGHPWAQEGYVQIPVEEQLDRLVDLGAGWYRSDWSQGAIEAHPELFEALVDEAAKRGIRLLPVIFPTTGATSDASPEAIQQSSAAFGRAVAERFRGRVTHWELANERDSLALLRKGDKDRHGNEWAWGDPNGANPDEYEETRYQKVKAEILGLREGIQSADPQAQTIVNSGGWLHFGFFERLVNEDKVPFDILGWHWYSEMGDVTHAGGLNVYEHLKAFGKPIWVTECDRRGGSIHGESKEQAQWLADEAKRWTSGPEPMAQAFFAYELLDEPYFGADNPESYYGLIEIRKGLDEQWRVSRLKDAFYTLQRVFRATNESMGPQPYPSLEPVRVARPGQNPFGTQTTCLVEGHEANRLPAFLEDVASAGYGWVKDYVHGGEVAEGADLSQKWTEFPSHYEEYLREAETRHLRVLLRVDAPRLRKADGTPGEPASPEACAAYARFLQALVQHFKPWVKDWEIDNEPNIGNESPRLKPEDYVALARAAADAVHAEDPEARVYGPASAMLQCLGESPYPYIPKLLEAHLLDAIDVFSYHPYRQPYVTENGPEHASEFHPWTRWGSYEAQLEALRSALKQASSKPVPIAATEEGWPTHRIKETGEQPITLAAQAKYEQRAMLLDLAFGVSPRINFVFKRPWDDPYEVEHQFNLVSADNTKRPGFFAAQNVCAFFTETPLPSDARIELDVSADTKPQVHAFQTKIGETPALALVLWASVPPDASGRYSRGSARVTVHTDQYTQPVLYDLLLPTPLTPIPVASTTAGGKLILSSVPLHDSPIVIALRQR